MPNLSSLNAVADYIGISRVYLWRIAGLLEESDYSNNSVFNDPQVRLYFHKVDKMPEDKRHLILKVIETLISNLE